MRKFPKLIDLLEINIINESNSDDPFAELDAEMGDYEKIKTVFNRISQHLRKKNKNQNKMPQKNLQGN